MPLCMYVTTYRRHICYREIFTGLFWDLTSQKDKFLDTKQNYLLKLKPKLNNLYDPADLLSHSDPNKRDIKSIVKQRIVM